MSDSPLPDLSRIYETYHGKVVAYASKLLGRDDADDVAQEVFVKVGRSVESLADPSKLTSWIYTITLNTVRDLARKRSVTVDLVSLSSTLGGHEDGDAHSLEPPDLRSRTPEQSASRHEMIACYLDYVSGLPRRYYVVYVLSEFEELSNDEIAHRLNLTLGTVKIRLHRARARLYDELRRNCRCYQDERGELMGEPKSAHGRQANRDRRDRHAAADRAEVVPSPAPITGAASPRRRPSVTPLGQGESPQVVPPPPKAQAR